MSAAAEITPFRVDIAQGDLDDLDDRLRRARWTTPAPEQSSDYGITVDEVRQWTDHWRNRFDWRTLERRINSYPQFTTEIDGQQIHFLHIRSASDNGRALILTHGWPGSIVEYLDVIDPLTAAGFDLVIPSIPGFGFSGPTTARGWNVSRIANAWVELMRRLGYDRYGAVGNDAGAMISPEVGRLDPEHVIGVHVCQVYSFPSGDPSEFADLSDDEAAAFERLNWFWANKGAFNVLQSQSPQTLAHALADSPAGVLAWNGQLLAETDDDFLVSNVALYWLTRTTGSSIQLYYEMAKETERPDGRTTVPLALFGSTNDFHGIRRLADRDHANIVSWNLCDDSGHYTAHQRPEALIADIVRFFADVDPTSANA